MGFQNTNYFAVHAPENNPFETIVVDVTHRCNMVCGNCYIPDRAPPDLELGGLKTFLEALPFRTNIRIAGAEATMRDDLPNIIRMVRKSGHRAVLLTNGLRLARRSYVDDLHKAGLRHVYLSLNGADNDDWYQRIDNLRCAEKKLAALTHCFEKRMLVNTGTILVRDVNEGAVERLLTLIQNHEPRHALLRFKNIGALGRYDALAETQNLSLSDMEHLVGCAIGRPAEEIARYNRINGKPEATTRLFPVSFSDGPGHGIWIKLTDWQADASGNVDPDSTRRGRLTSDFRVAPFFEDVRLRSMSRA